MNTDLKPLGILDGIPIKPCVGSGFCCTKSPCAYGELGDSETGCKHLLPPNEIGQRGCGRYDWIKENVPDWEFYPAFGQGCCMPLGNTMREQVIKNINQKNQTK